MLPLPLQDTPFSRIFAERPFSLISRYTLETIGANCWFGGNVTVLPGVKIGNGCWIGGGVIILPGVSIGDGTVIGAGSVVTKDIPANVVAVGNPCKVLREIGERDEKYYFRDMPVDVTADDF